VSPRRVVLGVGGLLLGAALGGLILWFAQREPQVSGLPLDFRYLPRKTTAVAVRSRASAVAGTTGMRLQDAPPEVFWSSYAVLCGGWDVVRSVGHSDLSAHALREPGYASALRCGRALYERYGEKLDRHWLNFEDDDRVHSLLVVRLEGLERLPEAEHLEPVDDEPKHLDEVGCMLKRGEDRCDASAPTVAKIDGMPVWLVGRFSALESFARRFDDDGDERLTGDLASMAKLHGELTGGYACTVGDGDGYDSAFTRGFGLPAANGDERIEKLEERVEKDVEAWSMVLEGDPLVTELELRLVFWAESADKAEELREDVEDVVDRLEKLLDDAVDEADDHAEEREKRSGRERAEFEVTDWQMSMRALAQASLEVEGERVILRLRQEPTDEQARVVERYRQWQRDRTDTAVSIVRSLVDDEEIHPDDLGALDPELPEAYRTAPRVD